MKKSQNSISDSRSESVELTIRLYRAIADVIRHLDDQRARILNVRDLFTENIELHRMKLKDYCEKLMFIDPVGYGKKAEDLLWRKGYYEVFATSKRLNKNNKMDLQDVSLMQCHLQSGIGYYHHLIMKIQSYFRLDLRGIVDFPLIVTDCGLKKDKNLWGNKPIESGGLEWAHHALHRCLIYLGDLSRYLSEIESFYDHSFAQRYYSQALNWRPECGTPHNQLGTLASTQNYSLDAAYYYMRCLCCAQKFDGAEGNLQHLFENNAAIWEQMNRNRGKENTPNVKKLLVTFIHISYSMFFDKQHSQIQQMCGDALTILENCIVEIESNLITVYNKSPVAEPTVLNDDILFKMLIISFMCIQQLKSKGSSNTMGGVALSLALMSQLINSVLKRLEAVLPPRLEPVDKGNGKKKTLRRRRKRRINNSHVSDLSEDENDSVYSLDSDISEEDLIFDCHESDEEPILNGNGIHLNGINDHSEHSETGKIKGFSDLADSSQPWTHPLVSQNKSFQHIHKLCNQGYILQTIKVCCDWLVSNNGFLKSCGSTTGPLLARLVNFLNHLSAVPSIDALKDLFDDCILTEDDLCSIPLPEDVTVRGLSCLQAAHAKLNWDCLRTRALRPEEETYSRIFKLIRFGSSLADSKICALNYDASRQWFSVETNGNKNGNNTQKEERPRVEPERLKLMGELWLKSEVTQLENKAKKINLPPYLVPDTEVFLNHPSLLKQLIGSKKFIVLIPSIVVSGLDEFKGTSGRVRDTIRWLENQLRTGHRSVRLQRSNEALPVPFIKYPKKKDKEAWVFLQIVECCNYVCSQSTGEKNPELVTLLTGSKTYLNGQGGFSHIGVAKSAGINVEHIESFYSKWKSCIKSHG